MSATPPTTLSQPNTNGQAGRPAPVIKRKPTSIDPLVQKRQPLKYRPPPVKRAPQPAPNGRLTPGLPTSQPTSSHPSPQKIPLVNQRPEQKRDVSGFSDPAVTAYRDFKVVTTKKQLLEGLRHHVLGLTGNQQLDIQNEEEFTRPVRLHRRDPTAKQAEDQTKADIQEQPPNDMDIKEKEAYLKRKEERQKEREANLAQIAPSVDTGKKIRNFAKKTEQVYRPSQSSDQRLKWRDKYEEKLPWHLEDFNEKHTLVGTHQPTMSHLYAAVVLEDDPTGQTIGRGRIVPIDKWYKFQRQRKANAETLEYDEVEKRMKAKEPEYEWLKRLKAEKDMQEALEKETKKSKRLYAAPENPTLSGQRAEDGTADLDFEDDFADDEEGNTLEEMKDEDQKLAEQRIKQELLQANVFDLKDEREVDMEEKREQLLRSVQGKYGKKLNKALRRREGNFNLGSDTDEDNPYAEDSSDTESELERAKKEEEEAKMKEEKASQSAAEGKSGTSTKGTNTPSGRKEKHTTASDRDIAVRKGASLKRPGSPNLSDAGSGTDASVRLRKHKHLKGTSTPVPGPRPSSTLPGDAQSKKRKSLAPGMSAGSDSEGGRGALSDGVGSDGGLQKRLKLNPPGSKSPAALTPQGGSRNSSPAPSSSVALDLPPGFPTPPEISALIPANGIDAMVLYKKFSKGRIPDDQRPLFWKIIQQVGKINKQTRWVMPRASKRSAQNEPSPPATSPSPA